MRWCKKDVIPLLTHWSYIFLALTQWSRLIIFFYIFLCFSSTLGSFSNSPSALFVASDGTSLRVYQTVIDARTLCTDLGSRKKSEVCWRLVPNRGCFETNKLSPTRVSLTLVGLNLFVSKHEHIGIFSVSSISLCQPVHHGSWLNS